MNKKTLHAIIQIIQKSNEQKTKALIINLGTATQLTLGGVGGGCESATYRYFNAQT